MSHLNSPPALKSATGDDKIALTSGAPHPRQAKSLLGLGVSGRLLLDEVRPAALRVCRLAETLFRLSTSSPSELSADVIVVHDQGIWRAKTAAPELLARAAELVRADDRTGWIADLRGHPVWGSHPMVLSGEVVFYADAPIRLSSGGRFGVLRVIGDAPRARDLLLTERLEDLAAIFAAECERLMGYEAASLRELFVQAPGVMAVARGPDFVFELANPAFLSFVGRDSSEVLGRALSDVMPEIASQGVLDGLQHAFRTGTPQQGRASRLVVHAPGHAPAVKYMDYVFQPVRNADGAVSAIFCQGADVTDAKLAHDALQGSQHQLAKALAALQSILDNSPDVICTVDVEGRFISTSKRAFDILGWSPDQLQGSAFIDLVHPADRDKTMAMWAELLVGGSTSAFVNRFIQPDGAYIPLMWSATRSNDGEHVIAIARDMRERAAAEEKLRRAQKMEAVGQLTGGIAHDFNNLLSIVLGNAELLQHGQVGPELTPVLASEIMKAASRGADLVDRLLAFGRRQSLKPSPVRVCDVVREMEPLLRTAIGARVELRLQISDVELSALTDRSLLESAILNLAINARDAMPDGGVLTVTTGGRGAGVNEEPLKPGQDVIFVRVSDTGTGIAPEVLARVFEPFFTTKDVGAGSGLGLSTVYGFTEQTGGRVTVESTLGEGTAATLILPAVVSRPVITAASPDTSPSPTQVRILLVEDEPQLLQFVSAQLLSLGHQVTAVANGVDALRVLRGSDFDVLFTDFVAPSGASGSELASAATAVRPGLRVVFTSGGLDAARSQHGADEISTPHLRRPYKRTDLAKAIEAALADVAAPKRIGAL